MNPVKQAKFGVLIVNLGTPDSPKTPDIRKYLREFLMDKRVIDIPFLSRWMLVNLIIAPFRAPKSAKIYQKVWTENGSPLKIYGIETEKMLQESLNSEEYVVRLAMRYQNPSIASILKEFEKMNLEKIVVIPLFPQYASASSGSVHQKVMEIISDWQIIPEIVLVRQFFDNPLFIKAFAEIGKAYLQKESYDHYLFTYHGLPESQIRNGDCSNTCLKTTATPNEANCCFTYGIQNISCYRAQCFETTRLLAEAMGLKAEDCSTTFQSRLGKDPWIKPYTDEVIKTFPAKNKKRILAFSPSFVADCLETTIEIGEEYKEIFEEVGGEHWQLVESLNKNTIWIEMLRKMVLEHTTTQVALDKMLQVIAEEKI